MAFLRPPSDRTQAARVFLISVGITAAFGMITARFAVQPSSLELVGTEVSVGPFYADIVLRDQASEKIVVVENMFGATDHDHLGKMITYAAGLGASHAVLVASEFRPEHKSALHWLNAAADETSFF